MKKFCFLILTTITQISFAQSNVIANDIKINQFVEGTLLTSTAQESPLVIILNDAGAIDRNGNERTQTNNATKKLAESLAHRGISSFRYDKRILKAQKLNLQEKDFRFDFMVEDVKTTIDYFKNKQRFTCIYIIGRGQGSLVGILAAQNNVDGLISIGGAAQSIDQTILGKIKLQAPGLAQDATSAFAELKKRGKVKNYNPALESMLRKDLQPFMSSWMAYTPTQEIQKINIPVLLIRGSKDLQSTPEDLSALQKAYPNASVKEIENMNYVLVNVEGNNDMVNQKSYYRKDLLISEELTKTISLFIKDK